MTTIAMQTTPPPAPTPSQSANDGSLTFRAVEGNPTEQYSGATLLVTAYAVLWVVIFAWIGLVWRKQRGLDARLADLEGVLDKAAAAADAAEAAGKKSDTKS